MHLSVSPQDTHLPQTLRFLRSCATQNISSNRGSVLGCRICREQFVGVPSLLCRGLFKTAGFYEREDKPVTLTRRMVEGIHLKGGTMLVRRGMMGSSS